MAELARARAHDRGRSLRGARTLELGCGLGLPSIAAALAGGRVLATDWSPEAVAMTADNAERNDARLETLVCSWTEPEPLLERRRGTSCSPPTCSTSARNVDALLAAAAAPGPEVWLADPGRAPSGAFLEAARSDWTITRARAGAAQRRGAPPA